MKLIRISAVVVTAGAVTASALSAHEHATGVVKDRMDAMESMAKSLKAITQRVRANRDLDSVKKDAQNIQARAAKMTSLFPPGSTQPPTEAKASIWRNWSDFEAKAKALEGESAKLAAIEATDAKALDAPMRSVSKACGGCHELYRAKNR